MIRFGVLVVSADHEIATWLRERLSRRDFEVSTARPGAELVVAVRAKRPHLAVLDRIDARPGMAQMEVALLKDRSPDVQIVALSDCSSERDGDVIELGVSCYLAGWSKEELLRVVERAAGERRAATDGRDAT